MTTRTFTALVQREGDGWVALCPELDVASQGESVEEARANLREAVELFLETANDAEVQQRLQPARAGAAGAERAPRTPLKR